MFSRDQHRAMRLRSGDVFGVEAFVEIDRGVDAAHDLGRSTGKAAAPHRIGRFLCANHPPGEDEAMKWVVAAALVSFLVVPGLGAAAEGDADMPDRFDTSQVAFAIAEEFKDQLLRSKDVEDDWMLFYEEMSISVWPEDFRELGEKSYIRRQWQDGIDQALQANQTDCFQFLS